MSRMVSESCSVCVSSVTLGSGPATTSFMPFSTMPGANAKNATAATRTSTTPATRARLRVTTRRRAGAGVVPGAGVEGSDDDMSDFLGETAVTPYLSMTAALSVPLLTPWTYAVPVILHPPTPRHRA